MTRCRECEGRRLAFQTARAAVAYYGPVRPFMRTWKEGGLRPLAVVAAQVVFELVPAPAADLITSIPPDGDRSVRRGHHPARGLAESLGKLWGLEQRELLRRRRPMARQTGLLLAERQRNARGAFGARGRVAGSVVLVDDVYTTGATTAAAASALRQAGAREVRVVTFARTVR